MPDPALGLSFARHYALAEAAVALLTARPRGADGLVREVLGLRNVPVPLAERLIGELLDADPRVERGADGRWCLREAPADSPTATVPPPAPGRTRGEARRAGARGLPSRGASLADGASFAVVDVETTGGTVRSRICELAIVHVDGGEVTDSFATLVDPGVPVTRWVTRLTGISNAMVAGAPRFVEISDEVCRRLEGRVFVAHNVGFDWRFMCAELGRSRALRPHGFRLCTVHLARRVLPGLSRRSLDSLAAYYGVPIEGRHRALGDARATARVLIRLLADAERTGLASWRELKEWLAEPPSRSSREKKRERLGGLPGHEEFGGRDRAGEDGPRC